ncbi:MAG: UDP-N-acetylglucosamine 1-carboxyvinyltransferase [Hyphomonadaceae bacterium]|nr:UDP-N-acetylglucosamine 1-carboxyvinyltransferase [Clostridia bacterium]
MSKIVITGGNRLEGDVLISGAKNAVLPIMAATILNAGLNIIHHCPRLSDVEGSLNILEALGCTVKREDDTVIVDSTTISKHNVPDHLMREMRSSVIFLGSIIARCKQAVISTPGGCEIGPRPIDLHTNALKKMGVHIEESHGFIHCSADRLKGAEIHLHSPSVGATENIMLTAVYAEGTTVIYNAAKEPEVMDLQLYLQEMGVRIRGAGTSTIVIEGGCPLHEVEHTVIADRIEAFTYLAAAALTRGSVRVQNVVPEHLYSAIAIMRECGLNIKIGKTDVSVTRHGILRPIKKIYTLPYPGFPTDMQAPMTAMLSIARGTSVVSETIFKNRFRYTDELTRMGADIHVEGQAAVIRGVHKLTGAPVYSPDLRGGAALVIAALAAEGETEVNDISHIERGYEEIVEKFAQLGATIQKVETKDENKQQT